jgi:integrase
MLTATQGRHHVDKCLYLQVGPDGHSRRYVFRFTSPITGRANEMSLGSALDVTLAEAKKRAEKLRAQIAEKIDPVIAGKRERAKEKAQSVTFGTVVAQYGHAFASKSSTSDMLRDVRRHTQALTNMPIAAIDTQTIARALAPLQSTYPLQAKRVLSYVARLLDFAKVKGLRTGDNPAAWRGTFALMWHVAKSDAHHAAMGYADVPEFTTRLRECPSVVKCAIMFTILTGARTSEVLGARHDEIVQDVWTLADTRTKQHREHRRPLTQAALDVIALARSLSGESDYLFPASHGGTLSHRTMERHLHVCMRETCSMHGFRASLRTFLGSETNVDFTTCEQILGHNVGDATVQAYLREASLSKMRVALQLWSDFCTGESSDNVIQLASRASHAEKIVGFSCVKHWAHVVSVRQRQQKDCDRREQEHDLNPDVDGDEFLHRADVAVAIVAVFASRRLSRFISFTRCLLALAASRAIFCNVPDGDNSRAWLITQSLLLRDDDTRRAFCPSRHVGLLLDDDARVSLRTRLPAVS